MAKEQQLQSQTIRHLRERYPSAVILKTDNAGTQGFPDWTMLYGGQYAIFDFKASQDAVHQPNQDYYIHQSAKYGAFAMFVCPENVDEFLEGLDEFFLNTRRRIER